MEKSLRQQAIDKTIKMASIVDEAHEKLARARMENEPDEKIFERLERLKHNSSLGVQRRLDGLIEKMVNDPGFMTNKPLD